MMDMETEIDPSTEMRCYCNKTYQNQVSFLRHTRSCRTASEDCRSFLRILACLDARPVPGDLFYRTLSPFRSWNENGNETFERIFKLEVIFDSVQRLENAINDAVSATALNVIPGAVAETEGCPWWVSRFFFLPLTSRNVIRNDLGAGQHIAFPPLKRWEFETTKVMLHTFPLPDLDPNFLTRGLAFSPFLIPLIQNLPADRLYPREVPRTVEVCVSATVFGDPSTKEVILRIAYDLAKQVTPSFLDASLQCCSIRAKLLLAGPGFSIDPLITLPSPSNRANAQKAEYLLLLSQEYIERNKISDAWSSIQQWTPRHAAQPSAFESIMSSRIDLMKGKILRFQGKFDDARHFLEPLAHQYPAPRSQFLSRIHLIAVYSELGLWEKAYATLESTAACTEQQERILELAKAEYYLARGLSSDLNGTDLILARDLFVYLSQKYMALEPCNQARKRNHFRVCVGLAVSQHIQLRRYPASSFRTLSEWMVASWAWRVPFGADADGGFPRLVCLLSMAEIKCRSPGLPDQDSADGDLSEAQEIWSRLERQEWSGRYIFTNIGTRWATSICGWLKELGKPTILPQ